MKRILLCALFAVFFSAAAAKPKPQPAPQTDREYWVGQAYRMALPVLKNLSEGTLRQNMPVEQPDPRNDRTPYTHLEAVGRLMAGIAPWLELPADQTPEGKQRAELLDFALKGLARAVDPASPDYLNFRTWGQPLVDAAYLAEAFLRAPKNLWGGLDSLTQRRMIDEMRATRVTRPSFNNWMMFAATIEAFLCEFEGRGSCDQMRTDYAFRQVDAWYVGDGQYSDGVRYHNDYYNSFVIHPMQMDAGRIMNKYHRNEAPYSDKQYGVIKQRFTRYAAVLERSISPEGTIPVVGRSITYRTGTMHALAQACLLKMLPAEVSEGQVRAALTRVMERLLDAPGTYDPQGWLTMGFAGHQMKVSEVYLSTGSMYMASLILLPLGLPADDSFWTSPRAPWTTQKAYGGELFPQDHSIGN